MMRMKFADRHDAGCFLALALERYRHADDLLVLALPRGGVPVGFEVSLALEAPLDLFIVRKLGVPGHEELAMGAIASGGVCILHQDTIGTLAIPLEDVDRVVARERAELARREARYREGRPAPVIAGRTIVLVDDGLATGASMVAAVTGLRRSRPGRIIAAAPVGSADAVALVRQVADECVCPIVPEDFGSVGDWYDDFAQTTDEEVRRLLRAAREATHIAAPAGAGGKR